MARISVFYDKEEKEQFFMLRGDEAYARSTSTSLELGTPLDNPDTHLDFQMDMTVNVLRDVDEAYIVIYDNDVPVYTIEDWSSASTARTITLYGLNYDIQHNFYARYMGNNSCRPSSSQVHTIFVQNTYRANTNLAIDSSTTHYDKNAALTKTVTLTNDASPARPDFNWGQEITIKYDGTEIDTYTTAVDGNTITCSIQDVGDVGIHTITAEYYGSEHNKSTIATQEIEVGYNLVKLATPTVFSYGYVAEENAFSIALETPFGRRVANKQVSLMNDDYVIATGTTNANGIVKGEGSDIWSPTNLAATVERGLYDDMILHCETTINNITYSSADFDVGYAVANGNTLLVSYNDPILSKNNDTIFSVDTGLHSASTGALITKQIPIRVYSESFEEEYINIRTNDKGIANIPIVGDGVGSKTFMFRFGDMYKEVTLNDYIQYWEKPSGIIKNKNTDTYYSSVNVNELNNYFSMIFPSLAPRVLRAVVLGVNNIDDSQNYEFELTGVTTGMNCKIGFSANSKIENGAVSAVNIVGGNAVPHSNERWKVVRTDGTVSVYRNNTLIETYDSQNGYHPVFYIYLYNDYSDMRTINSFNITFNKLTLRGVE